MMEQAWTTTWKGAARTGGWARDMMKGVWVRSTFARSACSQLYCKHHPGASKHHSPHFYRHWCLLDAFGLAALLVQ